MIKQVMNWIKTHRYCLAGLYMLVFLSGFFLLELHEPSDVHIIHCAVDDLIPFNEWFVLRQSIAIVFSYFGSFTLDL